MARTYADVAIYRGGGLLADGHPGFVATLEADA
jgi:hypothetical protein